MKNLKFLFMAVVAAAFASCGLNTTAYPTMDLNQTNVTLDGSKAYKVIGNVEAKTTATYVLIIGGFKKTATEQNSRSEMFKKANLKANQAVINIATTTSVKSVLGIWSKYTAISTGQVVEFE